MNLKLFRTIFGALVAALLGSTHLCHAQGADESNSREVAQVDDAEDGIIGRGAEEAEKLWDAAAGSVEGEAQRDLNEMRGAPKPTVVQPVQAATPIAADDDSDAAIEREIDQLADSVK